MTHRGETAAAAAGMTALAVLLTWPLALHARQALPSDLADPLLNSFSLAWDADRAAHGFRGLWNAPFFFPLRDTLAFSDHLLGIAAFTAPVQWLTGHANLAYNLAFIGSYALAGLAAFLLARSLWESRAAAWVAGVAFAAAPCRVMHVSHLQMLTGGWLALALWGLHRYFAGGSRRGLAVFAAGYSLLALSSSYLLYFAAVPIALAVGAGLWQLARTPGVRSARWHRVLVELATAAILVAVALAPVAAAYLRVRHATGLRRSLAELAMFSARWSDFVSIPPALHAWSALLPAGMPERMLFPGMAVVLLAATAVLAQAGRSKRAVADQRGWAVWLSVAALVVCTWLAFGPAAGLYRWLLSVVPGMDGLRVPARFIVVASLPLALLAGRGVQVLVGTRAATPAILSVLIIAVEGYAGPLPLAPFDDQQRERAALNSWLRQAPPGGVLELPITGPQFQPFTTTYQFNTLFHGHPIVNGYTGTGYALQDFLGSPTSPVARVFEIPFALRGLRSVGVRYVVVHPAVYERWTRWSAQPLLTAMDAEDGQIEGRVQFGDALAWKLADAPPTLTPNLAVLTRVSAAAFSASASRNAENAVLAFDGRVDTRWTTGAPQQGDEWFDITFARETDVAALIFRTDRTGHSERPHHLVVEAIGDDQTARTVFDGSLVPAMIAAFARLAPETAISLAPNRSRTLRLRQTGRGGRVWWSIYELQIYAR